MGGIKSVIRYSKGHMKTSCFYSLCHSGSGVAKLQLQEHCAMYCSLIRLELDRFREITNMCSQKHVAEWWMKR